MKKLIVILLIFSSAVIAQDEEPKFSLEVQAVGVWQTYNDVQIPNNASGTRFALDEVVGDGMFEALRISASWQMKPDHQLELALLPFTAEEDGQLGKLVNFNGIAFVPGDVRAKYKFNSYRLTYRYTFHESPEWILKIGATALIRDADVELEQGAIKTNYDNIGFVPLLQFNAEYLFSDNFSFIFDFNGLAGGPGRLLEGDARLQFNFNENGYFGLGYRVLEGGADVDDVYSFGMLHQGYLALGLNF